MSREDTRFSQKSVIVQTDSATKTCRFLTVIIFFIAALAAYYVFKTPSDSLGDPSDQFVITNIPKIYTKLEAVDPDERDVFQGFRTSYLPAEEIVITRDDRKSSFDEYGESMGIDLQTSEDFKSKIPPRKKRTSHILFSEENE